MVEDGLLYVYQETFEREPPSAKVINRRSRKRSMIQVVDPLSSPTKVVKKAKLHRLGSELKKRKRSMLTTTPSLIDFDFEQTKVDSNKPTE